MATTVSQVSSNVNCQFNESSAGAFSTTFGGAVNRTYNNTFSGVTFSKAYAATLSAAATPTTLNLNSGLVDGFNNALVYTNLKYVLIHNNDSTNPITVFGGSNPVIPNTQIVRAGCSLVLECSETVNSTTLINIKIDPGANTVSFDIILLGI